MVNLNDLLKFLMEIDKLNKTFIYNNSSIQPNYHRWIHFQLWNLCCYIGLHFCTFVSMCPKQVGWNLDGGNMLWQVDLPKPHLQWEPYLPQSTKGSRRLVMNGKGKTSIGNENWKTKVLWVSYHYLHTTLLHFLSPFVYLFTKIIIKTMFTW